MLLAGLFFLLTIGMVRSKLDEHKLGDKAPLQELLAGEKVKRGPFELELVHLTHSIPDMRGVLITTELGSMLMTGDYKFDQTPVDGRPADISRLAEIGRDGLLLVGVGEILVLLHHAGQPALAHRDVHRDLLLVLRVELLELRLDLGVDRLVGVGRRQARHRLLELLAILVGDGALVVRLRPVGLDLLELGRRQRVLHDARDVVLLEEIG